MNSEVGMRKVELSEVGRQKWERLEFVICRQSK